jgi:hypothetical protein
VLEGWAGFGRVTEGWKGCNYTFGREKLSMRRTTKYVAAETVAKRLGTNLTDSTAEQIYWMLEQLGYMWDSDLKEWLDTNALPAEPPMKKIMVRVWTDKNKVGAAAQAVIQKMLPDYELIQPSSKIYTNRPPQHNDARIYLEFMKVN